MPKLKRINARIPSELDSLLQELAHARGVSISEIVVSALKAFCGSQSTPSARDPYALFKKAGLVGCFSAGPDLSTDYKKVYAQLLDQKLDGK